jgi:hypothetical protein
MPGSTFRRPRSVRSEMRRGRHRSPHRPLPVSRADIRTNLRFRPIAGVHLLLTAFHRRGGGMQINGKRIPAMANAAFMRENTAWFLPCTRRRRWTDGRRASERFASSAIRGRQRKWGSDDNEPGEGRPHGVQMRPVRKRVRFERVSKRRRSVQGAATTGRARCAGGSSSSTRACP